MFAAQIIFMRVRVFFNSFPFKENSHIFKSKSLSTKSIRHSPRFCRGAFSTIEYSRFLLDLEASIADICMSVKIHRVNYFLAAHFPFPRRANKIEEDQNEYHTHNNKKKNTKSGIPASCRRHGLADFMSPVYNTLLC